MLPSPMKPTGPSLNPEKRRWRGNGGDVGKLVAKIENLSDRRLEAETACNHPLPPPTNPLCSIFYISAASLAVLYPVCP